jgi:hypothetical protein
MKKFALIALSVFTLLVSCKCKKAVTNETSVTNLDTNVSASLSESVNQQAELPVANSNQEMKDLVQYTATSRGFQLTIMWENETLKYTNQNGTENWTTIALTKEQKEELKTLLSKLPLDQLGSLQSPTTKRYHDGAAHADFKVVSQGKEYNVPGFDHGIPPGAIEKFVNKILSFVPKN